LPKRASKLSNYAPVKPAKNDEIQRVHFLANSNFHLVHQGDQPILLAKRYPPMYSFNIDQQSACYNRAFSICCLIGNFERLDCGNSPMAGRQGVQRIN